MANSDLMKLQAALEVLNTESVSVSGDPVTRAIQRPKVPTRSKIMAERQAIQMEFQTQRAKAAISKGMEVIDHGTAEMTESLLYSKHLERGFAGDLTDDEQAHFVAMRQVAQSLSHTISAEAAEQLRELARDSGLPSADVTDLDVVIRWLQEKIFHL